MTNEVLRRHLAKLGRKGGKNRFKGIPASERSAIMKKVRAAGVAKQRAAKAENGSDE